MNWPLASDYQDAIQNPMQCFQDAQLRAGHAVLNKLGLPRVASGTFASVYEMRDGAQRWAVRCFLRPSVDQQKRYALLSEYLSKLTMSGLVGFTYEPQGIHVKGHWFPIVKMEWVEGETLHTYIGHHVKDAVALRKLALQWRGLIDRLRLNHIAHADLQHGNVLVTPTGELRLVDYDGMFVPSLRGEPSHELGQPNYQHPQRTAQSYDEHLDNFAALVIYTSLVALIDDPGLWNTYHTGENLIFSAVDFKAPQNSAVFKDLYRSPEPLVRELSQRLKQACEGHIGLVPDFGQMVAMLPEISLPQPWWQNAEGTAPRPPSAPATPAVPVQQSAKPPSPAAAKAPSRSGGKAPKSAPAAAPSKSAPDADRDVPDWAKPFKDTPAGKSVSGVLLPLARLWRETAPASVPAPARPPLAPARLSSKSARRRSANESRSARWRTCTGLTCVVACLTLFGVVMLAQWLLGWVQTVSAVPASPSSASAPTAARSHAKADVVPASTSAHKM